MDQNILSRLLLHNFKAGDFSEKNYSIFDLHRPYVDDIILASKSGLRMVRELDLIDVWFDSGSMPYAQLQAVAPIILKRNIKKTERYILLVFIYSWY